MTNVFDLSGQIALVTGASSGLGQHFALILAQAGADVVLAARRVEPCQQIAEQIQALGRRAIAVSMDVTQVASVDHAVQAAHTELGPITILCNNAGIAVTRAFLEQSEDEWDRVLDTNLKGAYLVGQSVARHMSEHGLGGSIINTASIAGFRVAKQLSAYVASKGGLIQLTRAMALELATYNIRVNALAPGYIETEINQGFFQTVAGLKMVKRIPQGRIGRLSDLD
ncbi:MAG: SDR family NAD(P)-dependent oxidoreductase, partial [Candidatus Competibacteraceae bacterium]|nr:SDR family NAD(P)-dependent oxidoreductase [Candidatus Competibacteraceae bacterium]